MKANTVTKGQDDREKNSDAFTPRRLKICEHQERNWKDESHSHKDTEEQSIRDHENRASLTNPLRDFHSN